MFEKITIFVCHPIADDVGAGIPTVLQGNSHWCNTVLVCKVWARGMTKKSEDNPSVAIHSSKVKRC